MTCRIMLALQEKLKCRQNEAKVNRVKKVIEVARANAEEKIASAEDELDKLVQGFTTDTDVQKFIQDTSRALYAKDQAEEAINQLDRVEKYLFEELDDTDVPEEQQ